MPAKSVLFLLLSMLIGAYRVVSFTQEPAVPRLTDGGGERTLGVSNTLLVTGNHAKELIYLDLSRLEAAEYIFEVAVFPGTGLT